MNTMETRTAPILHDRLLQAQAKSTSANLYQTIKADKAIWGGWAVILLSALVFCIPLLRPVAHEQYLLFFFFNFGAAIGYHFLLWANKSSRIKEHRLHYQIIKLVLLLISAYSLNREMEVFAASPTWFSVLLVAICTNYLACIVFRQIPAWLQHLSFVMHGIAIFTFGYLAIYLLPLYAFSIPGLLLFGISLHTFVPLLFCILSFYLLPNLAGNNGRYWISFSAGIVAVFLYCLAYTAVWTNKLQLLNRQYNIAMMDGEDKLPLWVQVAQAVERDGVTEKILKTNLVYKIPVWNDFFLFNLPTRNFGDEQQVHDPRVVLATLFSGPILLPEDDRIKILESQYNARHQALERLWTGEDLRTEQVSTNIKVWPAIHLAYTEKILTLSNRSSRASWRNQGEGIYTFHLPEGGVVTSLSLWINGKEEKGILTTKEKAATAYRTVVGYERRDPSVVHWQEGNTVSVRVFPVMAGQNRTFKLGVTAPLRLEGKQLLYDNIWFDGPDAASAEERVKLEVADKAKSLLPQTTFRSDGTRLVTREGRYQPRWTVAFRDEGVEPNSFSFNGSRYSVQPYQPQRVPAQITDVYLDINQSWSKEDFAKVWKEVAAKKVWVYTGEMTALTSANKESLFTSLQRQSFSLFPFYLVKDPEHSLVVSKSGAYSPTISDLEGSPFLTSLQKRFGKGQKVRLFHFGADLSPYMRSLKERWYFAFETGDLDLLRSLLVKQVFVQDAETDNTIVVHSAGVMVTKQAGDTTSNAPDHLLRLFAYNHILQQLGRIDSPAADSSALIKEAAEAYVVSPVSSLVVLETAEDYKRFGIKDSENSLKNASMKGKGAVPEPGEWAIIILVGAFFIFFLHKSKLV